MAEPSGRAAGRRRGAGRDGSPRALATESQRGGRRAGTWRREPAGQVAGRLEAEGRAELGLLLLLVGGEGSQLLLLLLHQIDCVWRERDWGKFALVSLLAARGRECRALRSVAVQVFCTQCEVQCAPNLGSERRRLERDCRRLAQTSVRKLARKWDIRRAINKSLSSRLERRLRGCSLAPKRPHSLPHQQGPTAALPALRTGLAGAFRWAWRQ